MKTITENNLTWVDIEKPTQKDIHWIKNNFEIHPITLGELIAPSQREKVEYFDNYLFLILHTPIFHQIKKTTEPFEIDVLITKSHLITIHHKPIEPLADFVKQFKGKSDLKTKYFGSTTGHLFYWISEELINFADRQLVHIGTNINQAEDNMFQGKERELIKEISTIKRDILDFRVTIKPLNAIFCSLASRGVNFWPEKRNDLRVYFNDLISGYERIWSKIDNYTDTINALEDTHTNLLSNKTNNIIKTFTILSFTTFPAMLVAAILAANSVDAWIIVGMILFTTTFMWGYFKTRKWL
ncbi:MAG: magnesium transporter CorA family protein [Candidatus Azambacteria bacterium]|nr:magnesium transporter CorA family protein [Candidatus Azambacteria bacterium]